MKRLSCAVLSTCVFAGAALGQPANNDCANPIAVTNNSSTAFDLTLATRDGVASCSNNASARDVWYTYTSPGGELVTFDMCGSPGTGTKGIAVYTGTCGATTEVICSRASTDCGTGRPRVTFQANAGTYLINVHILTTTADQTGFFNVHAVAYPLANDACANAQTVTDGENFVTSWGATQETTVPCAIPVSFGGVVDSGVDVWFTYTAPATGVRNFDVTRFSSTQNDTILTIYDGCGGTVLACDDFGGHNHLSKIYHYAVTGGTTYKIRLGAKSSLAVPNGVGVLSITPPPAPAAFDACSMATPVSGQTTIPFSLTGLTTDASPTDCEGFRNDGWYAWTPSVSGIGVVTSCGLSSDSSLGLTMYGSCEEVPLWCHEFFFQPACGPKVCQRVVAGQTYIVRIGNRADWFVSTGSVQFDVIAPTATYEEPANAIAEPGNCDDAPSADLNGGCNVTPPVFTALGLCQTRKGTASSRLQPLIGDEFNRRGFMTLTADTDWYEFTLTTDQAITITGQSQFPAKSRIVFSCPGTQIAGIPQPQPNCSGVYNVGFTTSVLVSGTYYYMVSPLGTGNSYSACGDSDRYWFTITGTEPCPPSNENCCRGTTCNAVAAGSCTGMVAGSASITVGSCGSGSSLASCCYADFNHDGTQSIDDLFLYFNAYFTGSPWANVGGDGVESPTIDDLFLYISAYFTGCS